MIRYRTALIFALLLVLSVSTSSAEDTWKRISSFQYDWDNHGAAMFILEIPSNWSDPGDFTRVRIQVPGEREVVLTNKDGWVKYGSEEASLSLELRKSAKNLIRSEHVLAVKVAENRTLMLLFGYSYASSPGSLDALEISDSGHPRVVVHRDEFGLKDLRDLDGDGTAEVVGFPCLSQEWGNGLLTYDPFNVYKLGMTPAGPANLSLSLSKSYNLKHYYGWAGPKCSEDIAVVLHPSKGASQLSSVRRKP